MKLAPANLPEILVVAGNYADAALILRGLAKAGLTDVVRLNDGDEALRVLRGADAVALQHLKLVVVDINIPRLSGLEVVRQIKTHPLLKMIPVTMLTSSSADAVLLASYKGGSNSCVVKPTDFDAFVDAISQIGEYWCRINTRRSPSTVDCSNEGEIGAKDRNETSQ